MARKRTTRNGSEEGQVTIWLTPEEIFQLESICTIRMADSLAQICRGFILTGMQRETKDILASVALSYKVAERDQETDPSSIEGARDACGPVSEHAPAWTQADSSDGLIKFERATLTEFNPPELRFMQLDPPELDKKGLRGGEADEESLQKEQGTMGRFSGPVSDSTEQGTERANMHGTRNADLDPTHPQGTLGASMQSELAALHADDPRAEVASKILTHHQYGNAKGHEVDQ